MDMRRLQLLRELAERGSVTAVASATHRTPSAVSQQLKILEREAGVPLMERSGRGVVLTGAGRALARTATDAAIAMERTEALWREFTEAPIGEVTLTTFPTGGQMLLPGLLTALQNRPGLTLVTTDQDPVVPDFADLTPNFDIVLADSSGILSTWRDKGLTVVALMNEPLDIALPETHPLASKRALAPHDLIGETWVGVPRGFPYDRILDQIDAVTGIPSTIAHRFHDNGIVEAVVAAGHGIAILPRYTTRAHENGLVTRPITGVRARRQISALMRPDRAERPSVRLVIDALRSEASAVQDRNAQRDRERAS